MKAPLLAIFRRRLLANTLGACWFMASAFITFYSINSLFAAHLQADLGMSPALIATPIAIANLLAFIASSLCGWFSERIGRRWAMILPAFLVIPLMRWIGAHADKPRVRGAVQGLMLASAGLLLFASVPLARDAIVGPLTLLLAIASFFTITFTRIESMWVMFAAAAIGLVARMFV